MLLFLSENITYNHIISVDNLLGAWQEFLCGKRKRYDVELFQVQLMDNILALQAELKSQTYVHGPYEAFNISDPKPRNIHKARVRDRLVHHAIYLQLYQFFDMKFIAHSYSCRKNKGTHKALRAFTTMARKVSVNHTKTGWVLKCDIRKFFANIDHKILLNILERQIEDKNILWLIGQVVKSFHTKPDKGLPLGNLTSQLLVNVYMNEFDQFMKHKIKARYYIRYADDFVIFSRDKDYLEVVQGQICQFLEKKLKLQLHPKKVSISTIASGVDFLGWVHFPKHRVLRTVTKRRMLRNVLNLSIDSPTVQSYLGMLQQGDGNRLAQRITSNYFN